jgi:acyl carrier protein
MNTTNDPDYQAKLSAEVSKKVKTYLAEYLGTEPEDINDEDSFSEQLHMRPSDISDFFTTLEGKGVDTSLLNIEETQTVSDLIEFISSEESL